MNMMDYILEEKEVLLKIIDEFKKPNISNKKNILILATGSSYNAALSVKYYLMDKLNAIINLEEPFNYVNYSKIDKNLDLVILISQSGKSKSIVDAFSYIKENSDIDTLFISSNENSPIAKEASMFLNLNMGEEHVGFVTKGFSSTVLNLIMLGISCDEIKSLKKTISCFDDIIIFSKSIVKQYEEKLKNCNRFSLISYGNLYGISKEFETKFTETVRVPSIGYELEAYMHGPYLEANSNHILIFLNYDDEISKRSNLLKEYMKKYVLECISISPKDLKLNKDYNNISISLVMALIVQVLAYEVSKLKNIDLSVRIFDDFDKILKSKI